MEMVGHHDMPQVLDAAAVLSLYGARNETIFTKNKDQQGDFLGVLREDFEQNRRRFGVVEGGFLSKMEAIFGTILGLFFAID